MHYSIFTPCLPYHSLLLHLTISFPLPYHTLLPCLTISHSTTLHNCTNKLPWQFCHLMLSEVIGHHQRSPHFLQLLCEPWTPYFLLYFGSWKSNITKLTSTFHGCHGQRFLKFADFSITFSWQNVNFPWPTEQTIHPIHPYIYAFSKSCAVCMNGYFHTLGSYMYKQDGLVSPGMDNSQYLLLTHLGPTVWQFCLLMLKQSNVQMEKTSLKVQHPDKKIDR